MFRFFAVVATFTTALLAPGGLTAQTIDKSTLSGTVLTGSGSPTNGASKVILTIPAADKGGFVLTQFCSSASAFATLSGNTIGDLVSIFGVCQTYSPGLAVPPGEALSCTLGVDTGGMPGRGMCTVTGVLTKK